VSTLRERLIEARSAAKLSQAELAKRVQCGQTTIASIENGRNQGSKVLPRVAVILGVEVLWLAEGRGPKYRDGNTPPDLPPGALDPQSIEDPLVRIADALHDLVIVGSVHDEIMQLVSLRADESREQQRLILEHLGLRKPKPRG
jgi:transcriptional regulator with XRE-family HTH domain